MRALGRSALIGACVAVAFGALGSSAGAVVVRSSSGQFFGVALRPGVSSASLRGFRVPAAPGQTPSLSNGNMDYNGGPILHSSSPYLIFWDPKAAIPAASRTVLSTYLANVAADSGKSTNVYSALRQYTDTTGFADYSQTFTASQAILDTQAYPTTGRCPAVAAAYPTCLTDAQVQAELTRLIGAKHLPTGIGTRAPMYAVILPQNVNECMDSAGSSCGNNAFCAYHSHLLLAGQETVYSIDPFIVWALNSAKGCQTDGTAHYQSPNSPADHAYQIADNLSHENSETITDPLGTAWWNSSAGGNEVGDNCATYAPVSDPVNGKDKFAYAPVLGGSASAGTLFDQLINATKYYNQTEWSNGNVNCQTQNSAGSIVATFTTSGALHPGVSITFNPAGSSSTKHFSSTTWSFGDGRSSFRRNAPSTVTHVFTAAGTYKVTLTLVDTVGNLKAFSRTLTIM